MSSLRWRWPGPGRRQTPMYFFCSPFSSWLTRSSVKNPFEINPCVIGFLWQNQTYRARWFWTSSNRWSLPLSWRLCNTLLKTPLWDLPSGWDISTSTSPQVAFPRRYEPHAIASRCGSMAWTASFTCTKWCILEWWSCLSLYLLDNRKANKHVVSSQILGG